MACLAVSSLASPSSSVLASSATIAVRCAAALSTCAEFWDQTGLTVPADASGVLGPTMEIISSKSNMAALYIADSAPPPAQSVLVSSAITPSGGWLPTPSAQQVHRHSDMLLPGIMGTPPALQYNLFMLGWMLGQRKQPAGCLQRPDDCARAPLPAWL